MECLKYAGEFREVWDQFLRDAAWNGTFLHSRRFLSYHGDRFDDVSLLVNDDSGKIAAVFPAAIHPVEREVVVSHPGATFGGLVAGGQCRGERCVSALEVVTGHYREMGYKRLLYKAVPYIYHRVPYQDDLYALFRLGFRRVRCDISATIAAYGRQSLTKGRKYEISKARKLGVEVVSGAGFLEDIYGLVQANLWTAHGARPVHSAAELALLESKFPESVKFIAARLAGQTVAGLVMFNFDGVAHTQYIASNERGRETGALDWLIDWCIDKSFVEGGRYFDFGISNEKDGMVLNEGLYRYKRTFGAGSIAHEFYELNL